MKRNKILKILIWGLLMGLLGAALGVPFPHIALIIGGIMAFNEGWIK